ncbi:TATA box-binding protein-associated factor RNA polymerase I subunit C isoform X2 [Lissotriton helveticus]
MEFPESLFPSFYTVGPCSRDASRGPQLSGWGEYSKVQMVGTGASKEQFQFIPLYNKTGRRWEPAEPAAVPFLLPNADCGIPSVNLEDLLYQGRLRSNSWKTKDDALLNFSDQMANFYCDHPDTAFASIAKLLEENFDFGKKRLLWEQREDTVQAGRLLRALDGFQQRSCPWTYKSLRLSRLSYQSRDWLYEIPLATLVKRIEEEMAALWGGLQFNEAYTGGALVYVPWEESHRSQKGCLIYPGGGAMNLLNFQDILCCKEKILRPVVKHKPIQAELNGRILQITACGVEENVFVGLRSDYHCAAWRLSEQKHPTPLQVVQTENITTCINVSPHIPGELVVCTEGGSMYLWNVELGLDRVRRDTDNLFFNDHSKWRWSDFTAHPRIMTYVDRTGLEMTDVRASGIQNQLMFKIGEEADCQRGERIICTKYLNHIHPFHHLITTQFSLYILDERFPEVPMLKWNHALKSPPLFVHVTTCEGSNQIMLASQQSQEILFLQYIGGTTLPCQLHGPARKLSSISDFLTYLPLQVPHHEDALKERLSSPLAGVTAAFQKQRGISLMVMQLSQAGDLFYQALMNEEQSADGQRLDHSGTADGASSSPSTTTQIAEDECMNGASTAGCVDHAGGGIELEAVAPRFEVVVNNFDNVYSASDEPGLCSPVDVTNPQTCSVEKMADSPNKTPVHVPCLSSAAKVLSKRWMKAFLGDQKKLDSDEQRPEIRPSFNCKNLFTTKELSESAEERPIYQQARQCLRDVMKEKQTIRQERIDPLEVVSLPDTVDTEDWLDNLSQRLVASWNGNWDEWWKDNLGLNKDTKIKALREKRRRLKRTRSQQSLSGSFASTGSFTSDPFDFSDPSDFPIGALSQTSDLSQADEPLTVAEKEPYSFQWTSRNSPVQGSILKSPGKNPTSYLSSVGRDVSLDNTCLLEAAEQGTRRTIKRQQTLTGEVNNVSISESHPSASGRAGDGALKSLAGMPSDTVSPEELLSSQTLRHRGIPRERLKTVQDFFSVLSHSEPMDDLVPLSLEEGSSSMPLSFSRLESQGCHPRAPHPSSKRDLPKHPAKKKARMGF